MKVSLNWLKDYVTVKKSPEEIASVLTSGGLEVKGLESVPSLGDTLLEVEITSNRPDWLSHVGVAREVAALLGIPFKLPSCGSKQLRDRKTAPSVQIRDTGKCPYYTGCVLEGVEFGESPEIIRKRLEAVGLRPINLIVDVTNYVLLEMGQPLHAFDYDLLEGRKIIVRRAAGGEKITAINGDEIVMTAEDLVIADEKKSVAIAGVMGGKHSEVSSSTRNILLESAYFNPASVRRSSKRFNLASDSSYRFERGVDPVGVDLARERAIDLICRYAKRVEKISAVTQCGKNPFRKRVIRFPAELSAGILGVRIPEAKICGSLKALGLGVKRGGKGILSVSVPSFRADLERPVDLVEEVARIHGYDRIPETMPEIRPVAWEGKPLRRVETLLRDVFPGAGFNETVTFSLISEKILEKLGMDLTRMTRVVNPQNKELTLLRPTLFPSLLEVLKGNVYKGSGADLKIFEIANVFGGETSGELPPEEMTCGFALAGLRKNHWLEKARNYTLFDAKGVVEEVLAGLGIREVLFQNAENDFFEECLTVSSRGESLGLIGRVSKTVRDYYDLPFDAFLGSLFLKGLTAQASFERSFRALPKFPAARRDISIVVKETVHAKEIMDLIAAHHPAWIRQVEVADVYRGEKIPKGSKSMMFSIEYRSDDHTLTADEVSKVHEQLIELLKNRTEGSLRS